MDQLLHFLHSDFLLPVMFDNLYVRSWPIQATMRLPVFTMAYLVSEPNFNLDADTRFRVVITGGPSIAIIA
jgi:hypothetical protein